MFAVAAFTTPNAKWRRKENAIPLLRYRRVAFLPLRLRLSLANCNCIYLCNSKTDRRPFKSLSLLRSGSASLQLVASNSSALRRSPVNHAGITCSQSHARPKVAKYFRRFSVTASNRPQNATAAKWKNGKYFVRGTKNMLNNSPPDRKRGSEPRVRQGEVLAPTAKREIEEKDRTSALPIVGARTIC